MLALEKKKKKKDMIWQQINLNENERMVLRHHRNKVLGQLLDRSYNCKSHSCLRESGIFTSGFMQCGCLK